MNSEPTTAAAPRIVHLPHNPPGQPHRKLISIIIPTFNEARRLGYCIRRIRQVAETEGPLEIIVADGLSHDGTGAFASHVDKFVVCPRGRAKQLNRGAQLADGDIFFFLHATISLPHGALTEIRRTIASGFDGGGFSNRFVGYQDRIQRLRRRLSLGMGDSDRDDNLTFYGDNGIFVRRSAFVSLNGFANLEIMEDYEFSRRLAKSLRAKRILEPRLSVSPRRHLQSGLFKTRLQWIVVFCLYKLGLPTAWIRRIYSDPRRSEKIQAQERRVDAIDQTAS